MRNLKNISEKMIQSFSSLTIRTAIAASTIVCLTTAARAQTASIKGSVIDTTAHEPAIVDILLEGANRINTTTDENGNFYVPNLAPGAYTITCTSLGYAPAILQINLNSGAEQLVAINIGAIKEEVDEVVVVATRMSHTQTSVLNEMKSGGQVISGIAQEQIKQSQDKTAAQAMSRIPGITVVDGRFIMVRGIPERYNQVLLNNAIAPSTEVDKRTFSFDLIPSNILDRMMIYKSGSPENTGDFAGGLIKVFTATAASEDYTEFSLSTGFRLGTTAQEYIQSKGAHTDFLGFDNGYRQLPRNFPTENLRNYPNKSSKRIEAARLLNNNFAPLYTIAMPDIGVNATVSKGMNIGRRKLSTLSGISYGQSFAVYNKSFNRYLEMDPISKKVENRFAYVDNTNEKDNRIGIISNWNLILNKNNSISLKNLFTQIGENTTVVRRGEDFIQFKDHRRQNYLYQYRSRTIYSGQLEGRHEHKAFAKNATLNWVLGMNYMGEDQPDLRRFRTIETEPGSSQYRMVLPPSSNLYDAGRFYSKLKETGCSHGLNYTIDLNNSDPESTSKKTAQLKLGYMIDYRNRQFDTRYFSYFYPGQSSLASLQELERLPLGAIFAPENMKLDNGFSLEEGTRASDSYTASNLLTAGYAGIVYPLGKLNMSGGFRIEYNKLVMNAQTDGGAKIKVDNPLVSPLAFLNTDYALNEVSKLRFAYYRSVNRPEFRELAPFLFYDYQFDAERYGNPNLATANIDNFDLRYEMYPRNGEAISLGAFYKHFTNPIETLILIRSESPAFSYQNAKSAYSGGFELELRKSLKGLTSLSFLNKLSINLNAAYILSKVNYGTNASTGQESERALQGQSPYIINAMLNYNDVKSGWNISAAYNVFGPRIFAVSSSLFPTIYEMPRHAVDLTISKNLGKNWNTKLGVQDLLNAAHRFYQDTDRNTKIELNNLDLPIFQYKRGTLASLSLTYKF
jgi:hypothetical protein